MNLRRDFKLWTFNIAETVIDCRTFEVELNAFYVMLWIDMLPPPRTYGFE
jgi:hypothetical protein